MNIKDSKPKVKSPTLQTILDYVKRGWAVFPIYAASPDEACTCSRKAPKFPEGCPEKDHGKHPLTAHGLNDASKDPAQIRQWFTKYPGCNWAVATGSISGITVVDVDTNDGKVGWETFAALKGDQPDPQTLTAKTGSGGFHFVGSYCEALKTGNDRLGLNIDVKNDGAYVVIYPSNHRSGGTYEWLNDLPVAALPDWLRVKKETRGRPKKGDERRQTFTLEEVAEMLKVIPADNRDLWLKVGVILGREFNRSDAAWALYHDWADKWEGERDAKHEATMRDQFHTVSQVTKDKMATLGTIVHEAKQHGWAPVRGLVPIDQFVYYGKKNNFLYRSTGDEWVAAGVDAAVSPVNDKGKFIPASVWLKRNPITSVICDPTIEGDVLSGYDCREGVLVKASGANVFNLYRPPTISLGDPTKAGPWVDHAHLLMPCEGDADQAIRWLAHRRQHPGVKPRFALLISGEQGNGKDTLIDMAVDAVGPWNAANIEPAALDISFNEFITKTLIRISETADLHEISKWAFNERTKVLIAGRPDVLTVNVKYGLKLAHRMFCGVILTTNNLLTGVFIPPDDRRYDVIACATKAEMGLADREVRKQYFDRLYEWFHAGGNAHVAAYLNAYDLGDWSPAGSQRITEAHTACVQANQMNDSWLLDILDALMAQSTLKPLCEVDDKGVPIALNYVRADWVTALADQHGERVADVQRKLFATIRRYDYDIYKNPNNKQDRWKFPGGGRIVYAKKWTPKGLDMAKLCNVGLFGERF